MNNQPKSPHEAWNEFFLTFCTELHIPQFVEWLGKQLIKFETFLNRIKMKEKLDTSNERLFRLEYNEKQGGFHFDNYTHAPFTAGWITIKDNCTSKHCSDFAAFVYEKYPATDWMNPNRDKLKKLTTKQVVELYNKFIEKEHELFLNRIKNK